jgi:hypothetical protein
VVEQILVAQRNPQYPLTHQARHRVHHQVDHTVIGEAAAKRSINRIRRSAAPSSIAPASEVIVPPSNALPPCVLQQCKAKQIRVTLCLHGDPPDPEINRLCNAIF